MKTFHLTVIRLQLSAGDLLDFEPRRLQKRLEAYLQS